MVYRIRKMSPTGDYTFGRGAANFLADSPEAVAQRILTRLKLWEGDWYLDLTDGTPQYQSILGNKNIGLAEAVIRERVLGTPFVIGLEDFSVTWDSSTRHLAVSGVVRTAFGTVTLSYPLTPLVARTATIGSDPIGGAGTIGLGP